MGYVPVCQSARTMSKQQTIKLYAPVENLLIRRHQSQIPMHGGCGNEVVGGVWHEIFVKGEVYRRYADAYLKDSQVDC